MRSLSKDNIRPESKEEIIKQERCVKKSKQMKHNFTNYWNITSKRCLKVFMKQDNTPLIWNTALNTKKTTQKIKSWGIDVREDCFTQGLFWNEFYP